MDKEQLFAVLEAEPFVPFVLRLRSCQFLLVDRSPLGENTQGRLSSRRFRASPGDDLLTDGPYRTCLDDIEEIVALQTRKAG